MKKLMNRRHKGGFSPASYLLFSAALLATVLLCICLGSVNLPLSDTLSALRRGLLGQTDALLPTESIILTIRLPRVLCVALSGAALSLGGAAMQGLLRNPLADGSTLGVSSGASLGAALSIAFGLTLTALPMAGTAAMAMLCAFLSLILILAVAYRIDCSLSTNTIILIGIIFSMFANSVISLIITFAGPRVREITFWTLGSLAGSGYSDALMLLIVFALCGGILLSLAEELNAFALGEDEARHIGVDVRRIKLTVLICVSALVGVCVAVGGTIGFVGLVIPHMSRMIFGANHRRLLSGSAFGGAIFLMLADLAARTLLAPKELPIGVVTSFVGAIAFILIFYRAGRAKA